jgi:hypothetical protein
MNHATMPNPRFRRPFAACPTGDAAVRTVARPCGKRPTGPASPLAPDVAEIARQTARRPGFPGESCPGRASGQPGGPRPGPRSPSRRASRARPSPVSRRRLPVPRQPKLPAESAWA